MLLCLVISGSVGGRCVLNISKHQNHWVLDPREDVWCGGLGKGGFPRELTFLSSSWVMLLLLRLWSAHPSGAVIAYCTSAQGWRCKRAVLGIDCSVVLSAFYQFLALVKWDALCSLYLAHTYCTWCSISPFLSSLFVAFSFLPTTPPQHTPFPILFQDQILPSRIQRVSWSLPLTFLPKLLGCLSLVLLNTTGEG